jgi:hypothetical protein
MEKDDTRNTASFQANVDTMLVSQQALTGIEAFGSIQGYCGSSTLVVVIDRFDACTIIVLHAMHMYY